MWICEIVFFDPFVDPQTLSLSRKRGASVALECETDMKIEGPPVKAVPEAVRNRATPQSTLFKAAPEPMENRAPPPPEGTALFGAEMLGLCEAQNGTKFDELLQAGASEHKRAWQDVETSSYSRR